MLDSRTFTGKPDMHPDPGGRASGIAVPRLGRRWRPGLTARPVGTGRPKQVSSELRQLAREPTPLAQIPHDKPDSRYFFSPMWWGNEVPGPPV